MIVDCLLLPCLIDSPAPPGWTRLNHSYGKFHSHCIETGMSRRNGLAGDLHGRSVDCRRCFPFDGFPQSTYPVTFRKLCSSLDIVVLFLFGEKISILHTFIYGLFMHI